MEIMVVTPPVPNIARWTKLIMPPSWYLTGEKGEKIHTVPVVNLYQCTGHKLVNKKTLSVYGNYRKTVCSKNSEVPLFSIG